MLLYYCDFSVFSILNKPIGDWKFKLDTKSLKHFYYFADFVAIYKKR